MRILMIHSDSLFPCFTGGSKANLRTMESFAQSGHESFVLFFFTSHAPSNSFLQTINGLEKEKEIQTTYSMQGRDTIRFKCRGVDYIGVSLESRRMISFVQVHLKLLAPDKVCISETGGELAVPLFRTLDELTDGKFIYLPKTIECLPFGEYSVEPDLEITDILKRKAVVITASQFVADYIKKYTGIDAQYFYFPVYDKNNISKQRYEPHGKFITLFNGSFWKGLPIFLECARQLPDHSFLMIRGWGTTMADTEAVQNLPNVYVSDFDPVVSNLFDKSMCVLVPSICNEAFGQIVVQAMQRGIPVIASNRGGLPEAKLATDYILPVPDGGGKLNENERKSIDFVSTGLLWSQAIKKICGNETEWNRVSNQGYHAAIQFIEKIKWEPILNAIIKAY